MGGVYVASAFNRDLVTADMIPILVGLFDGSPYHGTTEQVQRAFRSGLNTGISACGLALPKAAVLPDTGTASQRADVAGTEADEPAVDSRPGRVTAAAVNLPATPSTSAPVWTVLSPASQIEVTGEAQSADGYSWYPVAGLDTGLTGFLAAPHLAVP